MHRLALWQKSVSHFMATLFDMRSLNIFQLTAVWALFGIISLVIIRVLNPIPSNPKAWNPPANQGRTGIWSPNNALSHLKTDIRLKRHDSVAADSLGRRYAGLDNGQIMRWQENGRAEVYTQLTGRAAGMSINTLLDRLYVVEEKSGSLWQVLSNRQTIQLPSQLEGRSLKYLNDVAATDDGRVYATRSSTRWPLNNTSRAVMEHNNDGAVYMWVGSRQPYEIARNLAFPNGIAIAHDKQSVLVTETTEYRVTRIWVNGSRLGHKEVVLDNLPGFPSDIAPASDGKHYWGTFFDYRDHIPLVDKLASFPWARRILLNIPSSWFPKNKGTPAIFLFDGDGNIKKTLQAPNNTELPGISSIVQTGNKLILSTANPLHDDDSRVFVLDLNDVGIQLN